MNYLFETTKRFKLSFCTLSMSSYDNIKLTYQDPESVISEDYSWSIQYHPLGLRVTQNESEEEPFLEFGEVFFPSPSHVLKPKMNGPGSHISLSRIGDTVQLGLGTEDLRNIRVGKHTGLEYDLFLRPIRIHIGSGDYLHVVSGGEQPDILGPPVQGLNVSLTN